VIFLSGRCTLADKLKAFELGGVDFIGKPFKIEEVEARVRTHLAMRRLRDQLGEKNTELEASYAKLSELEHLRNALVAMLIHDMRSPLSVIQATVLELDDSDDEGLVGLAKRSLQLLIQMIDDALDVNRLEAAELPLELGEVDAEFLVRDVVARARPRPDIAALVLNLEGPVKIHADAVLLSRVLDNLVTNASRYGGLDKTVQVRLEVDAESVTVVVEDEGPGIAPKDREQVFDQFWQATDGKRIRRGVGLGLTFCKLVVEAHGGTISAGDATQGKGAAFSIRLPRSSGSNTGQEGGLAES
jgi:two-component system sensor histidine kinase/response regulator